MIANNLGSKKEKSISDLKSVKFLLISVEKINFVLVISNFTDKLIIFAIKFLILRTEKWVKFDLSNQWKNVQKCKLFLTHSHLSLNGNQ